MVQKTLLVLNACNFKNIAEDIILLFDILNIKKPHLIGHSMGVNVALEIALTNNQLIDKIVLISGSPSRPQDYMFNTNLKLLHISFYKKILNTNKRLGLQFWKNIHRVKLFRKMILDGGFNPKQVSDEFVNIMRKKLENLALTYFSNLLKK